MLGPRKSLHMAIFTCDPTPRLGGVWFSSSCVYCVSIYFLNTVIKYVAEEPSPQAVQNNPKHEIEPFPWLLILPEGGVLVWNKGEGCVCVCANLMFCCSLGSTNTALCLARSLRPAPESTLEPLHSDRPYQIDNSIDHPQPTSARCMIRFPDRSRYPGPGTLSVALICTLE